jgi:hypothetical protein
MISEVKNRKNLPPRNGRVEIEKLIERFSTFQEVDQTLHRHAGTAEAWRAAHSLRVHPHGFVEPVFLIGSHKFMISVVHYDVMRSTALRSDQAFTYFHVHQPTSIEVELNKPDRADP